MGAKIDRVEVILEVDTLMEPAVGVAIPYYVNRIATKGEIVWYGLEKNWKTIGGVWHALSGIAEVPWVECDVPEYEKLYKAAL